MSSIIHKYLATNGLFYLISEKKKKLFKDKLLSEIKIDIANFSKSADPIQ